MGVVGGGGAGVKFTLSYCNFYVFFFLLLLYLRIDNRRQVPFWWRRTILGTSIRLSRSNTCIIYLLLPYFMAVLLI